MSTSPGNGAPIRTLPFSEPSKQKRRVTVGASFDNNLAIPTQQEIAQAKKPVIQANPPIRQQPSNLPETTFKSPQITPLSEQDLLNELALPELVQPKEQIDSTQVFEKHLVPALDLVEMRIDDKIDTGPFSERIALPSNGIFYSFNSVAIRPFKVSELALLYKAKKNRDIVLLNDTVSKTVIGCDYRDLWVIDARWVMYWHRMNSYVKTPYLASWESLYGNTNKTTITMSDIHVTPPTITREEYLRWYEKGFKVPNVRDMEHLDTFRSKLDDSQLWMYEKALYLQGTNLHEQKALMENSDEGVELLYQIKEFESLISKGQIVETATAKDQFFNYEKAIQYLGSNLEVINNLLNNELNIDPITQDLLYAKRHEIMEELARLAPFTNSGEAEPKLETITLSLGILDFFPDL
ncbi:MAG: hypothetical protein KGH75_03850 [Rhodospirillales bacterium]|nr:hypothetical protein [Rhodospirillales bacterium]